MKKRLLAKAIEFAAVRHANQFDKQGEPYFLHVMAVLNGLPEGSDEETQCIAVLHDVVEDCFTGREEEGFTALKNIGMTDRIVAGVRAMTKMNGIEYDAYLVEGAKNPDFVKVKMSDLRHNMDPTRIKGVAEKDMVRTRKYMNAYVFLKDKSRYG